VRCVLLVAIPTLAVAQHLSIVVLVAFMIVFGLASLANDAASQSFLPRLVPPRLLTRANARLDQSDAVAQTSGPALAGGLVSLLTAPWAVRVDAASYFASGLLLLRVPVASRPRGDSRCEVSAVKRSKGFGGSTATGRSARTC
jgi:MFS family permease